MSGYSDSPAPGTTLDSQAHFHPELTFVVQFFPCRKRSGQWILTDNGTVPPCCLCSADSCSKVADISHSRLVAYATVSCSPPLSGRRFYTVSQIAVQDDINSFSGVLDKWYHLIIGVITEWVDARIRPGQMLHNGTINEFDSDSSKSDGPTTSKQGSKSHVWPLMTLCLDSGG